MSDTTRTFKTAWFAKAADKAGITDVELCVAVKEIREGKADDLGGGVFKKRLNRNAHRSIILAKGSRFWFYQYLFAKKDRDNIDQAELAEFRKLARLYADLNEPHIKALLTDGKVMEICHGHAAQV
jgi:hypothetical protein